MLRELGKRTGGLQCGHGSDAVETSSPGCSRSGTIPLQCGHGSDAVETAGSSGDGAASPSFNAATAVTPWRPLMNWQFMQSVWLQCGHGSDAVETGVACDSQAFSRGFNAATAVTPWRQSARVGRFGRCAASMRPRQ